MPQITLDQLHTLQANYRIAVATWEQRSATFAIDSVEGHTANLAEDLYVGLESSVANTLSDLRYNPNTYGARTYMLSDVIMKLAGAYAATRFMLAELVPSDDKDGSVIPALKNYLAVVESERDALVALVGHVLW